MEFFEPNLTDTTLPPFSVAAVADDFTLEQLEERVCAAARTVLFLERDHIARTHGAGIVLATLSETDAAQRRLRQRRPGDR